MTETPVYYAPRKRDATCGTIEPDTDLYAVRAELEEIERRLIPLLVSVQRALGKEPSVLTQEERRRATVQRRRG